MEHFPSSGSAGGHPRVEESKVAMPVSGRCLSQARVLSGLLISNSLIRAREHMCRAGLPRLASYNLALLNPDLCKL